MWREFLDWLEDTTHGPPTTAVAHNGYSFDVPFLAAALKKARLAWPPYVRRQVDTLHVLNCAGLGTDPAQDDLARGKKLDGALVRRVGEHKRRSLEKVFRDLVHGQGFKGLKLVPHEADSDVAATFMVFTHPLIYGKSHKFTTAVKAAKRTATATVESANDAGSGAEDNEAAGDQDGDPGLSQAGSDAQADLTEDVDVTIVADEDVECLTDFTWQREDAGTRTSNASQTSRGKGRTRALRLRS